MVTFVLSDVELDNYQVELEDKGLPDFPDHLLAVVLRIR